MLQGQSPNLALILPAPISALAAVDASHALVACTDGTLNLFRLNLSAGRSTDAVPDSTSDSLVACIKLPQGRSVHQLCVVLQHANSSQPAVFTAAAAASADGNAHMLCVFHGQLPAGQATNAAADAPAAPFASKLSAPMHATPLPAEPIRISMAPAGSQVAAALADGGIKVFELHNDSSSGNVESSELAVVAELHRKENNGISAAELHWQLYHAVQPGFSSLASQPARAVFAVFPRGCDVLRLGLDADATAAFKAKCSEAKAAEAAVPAPPAAGKGKPSSAKGGKAAAAAAAVPPTAPPKPDNSAAEQVYAGCVALRCPAPIVCSAANADGSRLLLALESGCLFLYNTQHVRCISAISACLPSKPAAVTFASANGTCSAAMVGVDGRFALWHGEADELQMHKAPLPFGISELVVLDESAETLLVLASTQFGKVLIVDCTNGTVLQQLKPPSSLRCSTLHCVHACSHWDAGVHIPDVR